jgi:sugar/nucleoside kinase (ribokinase family)
MDYADLADVLRDDAADCTITAFPDGSIDMRYRVTDGSAGRLAREEFGERIASGESDTFSIEREERAMGGQAVNMARQATELEDTVHLYGYLDHSIFDSLACETVSMGEPATVYVYDFGSEVMLADNPDAMSEWSLATLRDAMGDTFEERMTADAVCCANWISFDGMTDALSEIGELSLDGNYFVLDPGDLTVETPESVASLCSALETLEQSYDVVISTDGDEMTYLAESLAVDVGDDAEETLRRLGNELAVTGIVLHGSSEAIAATPDGMSSVLTIHIDGETDLTGAGDRFGAGLAHGLAREWGWDSALQLGNLCSSYHVEQGETGSKEMLASYADSA